MIRRHGKLLLVHVPANALLLWLAYEWLGLDESSTGRLVFSAVDALAILTLICWLYGATLVRFRSNEPRVNDSFRLALRHIGGLLTLGIVLLLLYGLLAKGAASIGAPALKTASWLTWTLRTPIKPAIIAAIFGTMFRLLQWAVVPVILLPVGAAIATHGFGGWREIRTRRPWKVWLAVPVLALAAFWLPLVVLNWAPRMHSSGGEMASFVVRAAVAYALFVLGSVAMLAAAAAVREFAKAD